MAIKDVHALLPLVIKKSEVLYDPVKKPVIRPGQAVYPSGYPLSRTMMKVLDQMESRLKDNFPAGVVIEGGQGKGKTTLATLMGDYIQGSPIDIESESDTRQIAYPGEYIERLEMAYINGLRVLILDEASFLAGINAGKREVKDIVELWNTIRQYGIFVILCLPQGYVLHSPIIDQDVIRLSVRMVSRDTYESRFKWYDVHKTLKIRERQKRAADPATSYYGIKHTGVGVARPLPDADQKMLDKVSMVGKSHVRTQKLITEQGYLDTSEIAAQFGKSVRWAQMKVKKTRAKPVLKYRKRNYYAPEIIDLVSKYVEDD